MSEAHEQEIGRLLQISMAGLPGDSATREELSRIWSLELQWFTPQEADLIADRLSERGWLVEAEGRLSPPLDLELPCPPLGRGRREDTARSGTKGRKEGQEEDASGSRRARDRSQPQ